MNLNPQKLDNLLNQIVGDIGSALSVPLVRLGNSLGLYQTLRDRGPITSKQLAEATGLAERYLREWLAAQAAANYIMYHPETETFALSPEQAAVLADENSPAYMTPAFDCAAAAFENQTPVQQAFQTGEGVAWNQQAPCLACAVAKFFRPGYQHNLVQHWLPAFDGVVEKLERGAKVADVGCGHGLSTLIMAQAFPNSEFIGFDFHDASIDAAREHARSHHVENLRFETAVAKEISGTYDLVTLFDCLHDFGDPIGTLARIRQSLAPDGTCAIIEPAAGDRLEDNFNPVGRLYYSSSTMICVPTSLAQEVGAALGAQAGEQRLREVAMAGGFNSFRCVTKTPFNLVLEARL
ncbi:class I SAM-dependent methyltransferase [Roseofilum casamattae]|uniref:Class I SAM-dependent methyltransferase n=1 Tax=Roseofilum casamattae BLCC-M143 TaxID=3022442 RepID=A0ABT7C1B9_9CYAN|nr:class I SAM-dependent methyltransferase [Roseofilum casamattae]MDJ1185246.1 class I SAM-dependent methyltransferase [Roseofilum casamattae BLCC-M143]